MFIILHCRAAASQCTMSKRRGPILYICTYSDEALSELPVWAIVLTGWERMTRLSACAPRLTVIAWKAHLYIYYLYPSVCMCEPRPAQCVYSSDASSKDRCVRPSSSSKRLRALFSAALIFFASAQIKSESCWLCISLTPPISFAVDARGSKWFTISLQIGWRNPSSASDLYGSNSIYLPRLPGNAAEQKIQFRSPRVTEVLRRDVMLMRSHFLVSRARISISIFAPGLASFKLNFATGNSACETHFAASSCTHQCVWMSNLHGNFSHRKRGNLRCSLIVSRWLDWL